MDMTRGGDGIDTMQARARRIPDVYLHLGGTHVHHLNYGIFLLAAVGGFHHWAIAIALAIATVVFGVLLVDSFKYADRLLLRVQIIEQSRLPLP